MSRFGFLLDNAEIVDTRHQGSVTLLTVHSSGATKRAALRGARKEASSIIPAHQQNVINSTEVGGNGFFREQWMFTISSNGET